MAVDFSAHMFKQMNQDLSFDKRDPNHYWEAMNMELVNNGQTLSLVSTSGTEIEIELLSSLIADFVWEDNTSPQYNLTYKSTVYNFVDSEPTGSAVDRQHLTLTIIGMIAMREDLYIFVQTEHNLNIIFRYIKGGIPTLVYAGYMEMTTANPIELHANYENELVQKLYWVDGVNWVRTLNVSPHADNVTRLETFPIEFVDIAVPATMKAPTVDSEATGGSHKAGRIQYAYTLYNRSGQQTVISPFSQIYSLSDINGVGGAPDENISIALSVSIPDLDTRYDSIRIYSIHYNQEGETPDVILILDEGLSGTTFSFIDDGNLFVSNSTMDTLIALNNNRYKGGTLNVKKNRLFLADYSIDNFDFDFDARAYSYDGHATTPTADIDNVDASDPITVVTDYSYGHIPEEHDAQNVDPTTFKYIYGAGSTVAGGTGQYIEYRHSTISFSDTSSTFLKQGEKYRIGIMFRDEFGRTSAVKWVADTIIPYSNISSGFGRVLRVALNEAGYIAAKAAGAVGYSVLMVNRNFEDRDIIAQGFIVPTFQLDDGDSPPPAAGSYRPYYITKDITTTLGGRIDTDYDLGYDFAPSTPSASSDQKYTTKEDKYCYFYSPDVDFRSSANMTADYVNIIGTAEMTTAETIYDLYRSGSYSFTREHESLKFQNLIWDTGTAAEPVHYMGNVAHNGDSYETFFKKTYGLPTYITGNIVATPLEDSSFIVETGQTEVLDTSETTTNSIILGTFTGGADFGIDKASYTTGQDAAVLTFNDPSPNPWHYTAANWDKFATAGATRQLPLVDLKKGIVNQYGGDSFEARRRNSYVEIGEYSVFPAATVDDVIITSTGDVFLGTYIITRMSGQNKIAAETWHTWEYLSIPLESYVDVDRRYDNSAIIPEDTTNQGDLRGVLIDEWYAYNTAYSQAPDAFTYIPKPYNFQEVLDFDSNIIATGVKFNNEVIDTWTNFLPNEVMQLDSKYGKITKLQEFKGEIYAFQPKAIAAISILPRVQVQASDGINLELGTGLVLQDYNYITTASGSLNKWSILSIHDEIFYYDYYNKSISSLQEGSISTKYNIQKLITDSHIASGSLIKNDNPLLQQGVLTSYDANKKNIYFSFSGLNNMTISFNALTRGFVSLHSFYPKIWIELNGSYISTNTANKLYEHIYEFNNDLNRLLYGNTVDSYITILSSKEPILNKIFGNVELDVTGDAIFNSIEAWNDYQTTGIVSLVERGNIRHSYRKWRIALPREENSRNMLSDTKLWVKLRHDYDVSNPIDNLVLNNVEVKYTK